MSAYSVVCSPTRSSFFLLPYIWPTFIHFSLPLCSMFIAALFTEGVSCWHFLQSAIPGLSHHHLCCCFLFLPLQLPHNFSSSSQLLQVLQSLWFKFFSWFFWKWQRLFLFCFFLFPVVSFLGIRGKMLSCLALRNQKPDNIIKDTLLRSFMLLLLLWLTLVLLL